MKIFIKRRGRSSGLFVAGSGLGAGFPSARAIHRLPTVSCFLIFLLLFGFFSAPLSSQLPSNIISRYGVNDGLAQSTVNCILRDQEGFLWVGTCGGLSRFDGYKFISFKNHPDYKNSMSDNYVRWLHEAPTGNIWIGTEMGLDEWDARTGNIRNLVKETGTKQRVWYIPFFSSDRWLYFADSHHGISRADIGNGQIENMVAGTHLGNITNVTASGPSGCWLCSMNEKFLVRYTPPSRSAEYYTLPPEVNNVFELLSYSDDFLLLATDKGLYLFDVQAKKFSHREIVGFSAAEPVKGACRDNRGLFWFSVNNRWLVLCDPSFHVIKKYLCTNQTGYDDSPGPVTRLYSDREGNIWTGTDGNGLFKISPALSKFPSFRFNGNLPSQSNFIRSFTRSGNGKLFVGTYNAGLFECDPEKNLYQGINLSSGKISAGKTISGLVSLDENKIVAATETGLVVYDAGENRTLYVGLPLAVDSAWKNEYMAACLLHDNRMMAGGKGFLFVLSLNKQSKPVVEGALQSRYRFIGLYEMGKDSVLAGLLDKGFLLLGVRNKSIALLGRPVLPEKYRNALFRSFLRDEKGMIWAATDLGLMKFSPKLVFVSLFTENNGLVNNDIYGILEDRQGRLWLSTNKGISVFNPGKGTFVSYGVNDGLQSAEFNSGAFYEDAQGEMFFGGIEGFNYFYPDSILPNRFLPRVALTGFSVVGEKVQPSWNPSSGKIRLKFFQNYLLIEVAALEFTRPEMNQYAFFLEGQDNAWMETGINNFIRYNNLQPGKYKLWVKASNNDRQWSEPVNLLTITLVPPFWKTLGFRIAMLLLLLLLGYLVMRWYFNRRMKRRLEEMKRSREIDDLRAKISRDLHDNAGTTLTRISMIGELAKMELKQQRDIAPRLDSITASSRSLVDNFDEIIWATNPEHDNLQSLAAYIRTFISEFTSDLPLQVVMSFPDNIPPMKIKPDLRHHLFLMVKECVNNCVKHAQADVMEVSLVFTDRKIEVTVSDDGIGMGDKEGRPFGNGLDFIQKRAKEIGGECIITSAPGKGTAIRMVCPLS